MENYQRKLDEIIKDKTILGKTLLLHSCCGPCSSYVLTYLANYFKITVYYYNPNIEPEDEFKKRALEQEKLIKMLDLKYPIDFILGEYDNHLYHELVKGLEDQKEGSKRCYKCYEMRINKTALLAKKLNYDYFCTTLSVSPYKNAFYINEIGSFCSSSLGISFLPSDFKKKEGYKKSIELSRKYGLYRQNYCGCIYSKRSEKDG